MVEAERVLALPLRRQACKRAPCVTSELVAVLKVTHSRTNRSIGGISRVSPPDGGQQLVRAREARIGTSEARSTHRCEPRT